jgi:hypothetical protein
VYAFDADNVNVGDSRNGFAWAIFGAAVALGAIAGWTLEHSRQPFQIERTLRLQIDPPENGRFVFGSNTMGGISLSPDGRVAAYVGSGGGKYGVRVRPLDGTARFLPGTEGAAYPIRKATGFEVIEEPRSAWMVNFPGSICCFAQVSAISRFASSALSPSATIQPTT